MRKFAFVSRHEPTATQHELARKSGIELIHVGDRDAFAFPAAELQSEGYVGVVVVHPQAALTAIFAGLDVGVFNNVNRAPIGERPQFETTDLVITSSVANQAEAAYQAGL